MGRRELLHDLGLSRTGAVRWLTAREGRRAPRPLKRWLASGPVVVLDGHAAGLLFDPAGDPLGHTHIGGIVRGNLELGVQEAIRRSLPAGGVLVDVGANLGFFTLLGAKLAGEGGHAYAIEPVAENAAAVRHAAELNGLRERVTVLEAAASSAAGRGTLFVVGESGWSHLSTTGRHADVREERPVELVRIDDLELRPPDVVKIDTEGAEVQVLEGMRETIAAHGPAIVCECHDNTAEVLALLRSFGYAVENIDSATPVDEAPVDAHLLARRA